MLSTLPHSVGFGQPNTVAVAGYRIRMANPAKLRLVENLLLALRAHLRSPDLNPTQAVTALTKLGIATGNAQRLLDDHTDIRISTVQAVADKLRVGLGDLLQAAPTPNTSPQPAAPTLAQALPVVLDALATAPERDRVRTALMALLDDDAPAYRQRLAELLTKRAAPLGAPIDAQHQQALQDLSDNAEAQHAATQRRRSTGS